jgi:uncharacterized repeat protein (TIGR01451 family)
MNPLRYAFWCLLLGGIEPLALQAQNDKVVIADDHLTPEEIAEGAAVIYRIRFQNTGSDTAAQVVVQDTIDPRLDVSTLDIIDSSHAYTLVRTQNTVLQFIFNDICLPPAAPGITNSTGYLIFSLRPQPSLAPGQVIYNRARISFDSLEFLTNQAPLWIDAGAGSIDPDLAGPPRFRLAPNPNYGQFELQTLHGIESGATEEATWWVAGSDGRPIARGRLSDFRISLDRCTPGLYWLYVHSNGRAQVHPFTILR